MILEASGGLKQGLKATLVVGSLYAQCVNGAGAWS